MIDKALELEWASLGFMPRMVHTAKIMTSLYKIADQMLDQMVQAEATKRKRPTSCAGCREASCCHQVVYVSALEGLWLTRGIRLSEWDSVEGVRRLRACGRDQMGATLKEWAQAGRPCPFLACDGTCSVYAYRPLACRWHYVWCEREDCTAESILAKGPPTEMLATEMFLTVYPVLHKLQTLWGWGPAVSPMPHVLSVVEQAIVDGPHDHLTEYIVNANMKPAGKHRIPLPIFWPGVDLKAEKRGRRRKR